MMSHSSRQVIRNLPEDGLVGRGHDDALDRAVGLAVLDRRDDLLHEGQVEGVGRRPVEADDRDAAGGVLLRRDEGGGRHPQSAVPDEAGPSAAAAQERGGHGAGGGCSHSQRGGGHLRSMV